MTTLIIYILCGVGIYYLVRREYIKERAEYEAQNGLSKNQVYKGCKYMRDDNSKASYQELLQNLSKN
jgi:hypothetical protein